MNGIILTLSIILLLTILITVAYVLVSGAIIGDLEKRLSSLEKRTFVCESDIKCLKYNNKLTKNYDNYTAGNLD